MREAGLIAQLEGRPYFQFGREQVELHREESKFVIYPISLKSSAHDNQSLVHTNWNGNWKGRTRGKDRWEILFDRVTIRRHHLCDRSLLFNPRRAGNMPLGMSAEDLESGRRTFSKQLDQTFKFHGAV